MKDVVARKPTTEAAVLMEANRLLIEYMGDQHDLAFLSVQHKWGRIMALELNEHATLTTLSAENAFTLLEVVESIREELSHNYMIIDKK